MATEPTSSTPILDTLNVDLSYKVFDPVSEVALDGKIYNSAMRTKYINRAQYKLLRLLEAFHPDITEIFPDYYNIVTLEMASNGEILMTTPYVIKDLYYAEVDDSALKRALRLDPTSYHPKKAELNELESPDETQRYWCEIGGSIKLLPDDIKLYDQDAFQALVRSNFPEVTVEGDTDIFIPTELHDILLSIASAEASLDRGRWQFYEAATNDYIQSVQLFLKNFQRRHVRSK